VGPGRQRKKEKRKRDGGRGLPRGKGLAGCWTAGPKGKRGEFLFVFSFSFPFSNQPFKFKFKSNLFKLFTECL
jgi:hypothetical protein